MTERKESEIYRNKLFRILIQHIGRRRAIGMGELHTAVFGTDWENRINHTRRLRYLVTELRREGVLICSYSSQSGGGYYLAAAGSEMEDYLSSIRRRALKALVLESRLRKIGLPDLLGQMQLNLKEGQHNEA